MSPQIHPGGHSSCTYVNLGSNWFTQATVYISSKMTLVLLSGAEKELKMKERFHANEGEIIKYLNLDELLPYLCEGDAALLSFEEGSQFSR